MAYVVWFNHAEYRIGVFYIKSRNICAYLVYFKSKKELNYVRFVDPNLLTPCTFGSTNLSNFVLSP